MNPIEIRNTVRQLVVKHRFKQAIERLLKWADATGNDWVASEANRLLDDLDDLPTRDHVELADRIFVLAECVVTGGYPEIGGNEKPDLTGSASAIEFGGASEVSSEISGMSDHHADISEGMPPPMAEFEDVPLTPQKSKTTARPSKNSGGFPTEKAERMPTTGSKSKPIFSAKPPPPPAPAPIAAELVPPAPIAAAVIAPAPVAAASIAVPIPVEAPQMGGLLYNIPSKMRQNEDTTCIVRIAFDKTQLKTTDDTFSEEVVKEVRVSRLMEVEIENEGTEELFRIVAKSEKQQSLDTFEATEWRFAVRPLVAGKQSLLLKVTIVETDANGKESRKTRVLEESISISTSKNKKTTEKSEKSAQKAKNTEGSPKGFVSADLKLTDLKTLLFMGANPPGTRTLQLEVEHSRIATKINNRFRIEVEKFLSASEIPELIISKSPTIIHFSGHGKDPNSSEQGETDGATRLVGLPKTADAQGGIVVFDDTMRGLKVVDNEALDFMFQNITTNFNIPIEVVVFNSCYSESQAKVIGKYVPYVVGSARAIGDDVAIAFASGFYFGISQGLNVEKAFSSGKMQAVFANNNAKDLIVLYKNGEKIEV
jgi:hypothetical protein